MATGAFKNDISMTLFKTTFWSQERTDSILFKDKTRCLFTIVNLLRLSLVGERMKNGRTLKEWTNYFVKNSVKLYICTNYRTQFCIDVKGFHAQITSIAVFPEALQALLCLCPGLWHRSIHPVILPAVHKSKTFELS